jgi:hypothetical protein
MSNIHITKKVIQIKKIIKIIHRKRWARYRPIRKINNNISLEIITILKKVMRYQILWKKIEIIGLMV